MNKHIQHDALNILSFELVGKETKAITRNYQQQEVEEMVERVR